MLCCYESMSLLDTKKEAGTILSIAVFYNNNVQSLIKYVQY